MYICYS